MVIKVDWDTVDHLLMAGCDGKQVAARLGMCYATLERAVKREHKVDFVDYKASKRAKGDSLIHEKQFEIAQAGDKTMLVWLGKQRLDQSDNQRVDHTTNGEKLESPQVIISNTASAEHMRRVLGIDTADTDKKQ